MIMVRHISPIKQINLASPKGGLEIAIYTGGGSQLQYDVSVKHSAVIETSSLGITIDGIDLGSGCVAGDPCLQTVLETYPTRGWHAKAVNHYNELKLPLSHEASGTAYELEIRAYEDGAAYRYVAPGKGIRTVHGEASSWRIPEGSGVWIFERNNDWKLKSYAGEFIKVDAQQLSTVSSQGPVQGTPMVIELPDGQGYAAIMEAALYHYSGMRLEATGDRAVQANFTEGSAGFQMEGDILTPWRVTLYSPDLNGLVNCDLLTNLNPSPSPELFSETEYIKPGRSVWRWWSLGTGTPDQEREMIDCAEELGFEYTTIDEGWELWQDPWEDLRQVTNYAADRSIGVFVWKRSKEIDSPANDWRNMRDFLDKARSSGAAGVKIDFIDCESKASIDFEINALQLAAERKLMINFHGISKPTGESRTYPNEISREGIRGLELNKMKEGPIPAWHNAALPFTRFVAGHGDYTPVGFSNSGLTTHAHQLATAIVFTSPMQVIAENPKFLLKDPSVRPALDLLKAIPSVWDETRVLAPSAIGQLALFARRSGTTWFLGILNGTDKSMLLSTVDLSFLGEEEYEAEYISDREPGSDQETETKLVRSSERLTGGSASLRVPLSPAGGFVARFTRV
jgi:alpha-glucosidase